MREFNVDATVGKPQVAYRETITKTVESVEYRHIKQSGGSGQFAVVKITPRAEPRQGLRVRRQDQRRQDPARVHPAGQPGHPAARSSRACSPATRRSTSRRRLVDGQYHDVDSSEMAFKIAGQMAFKKAAEMAKPVLLEPIMAVEVVTPEDYMGDVMGDLSQPPWPHRGHGGPRQHPGRPGPGAAVGDVRLLDRPALAHTGPGHLHDAVRLRTRRSRTTSPREIVKRVRGE